jgi:hypothetical protein
MRNLQAARVTSAVGGVAAIVYCIITLVLAASKVGDDLCIVDMPKRCRNAA